jgi:hypothetical protein
MNTSIETGTALEMVIHEFAFAHALLIVLGIQHLQKRCTDTDTSGLMQKATFKK